MRRSSKHNDVRKSVEEAIRSGQFGPGDQLPSEVELAQRCNVSYMTARKAVAELVADDILERRASKGTFVRHSVRSKIATVTLNLVVGAYEGSHVKEFLLCGVHLAKSKGWNANIIRLAPDQQDPAVRAIRNGELAIVMLDDVPVTSALWLAMKASSGRAISFHQSLPASGVYTILSEPTRDLNLAIAHLRKSGHTKMALVVQMPMESDVDAPVVHWQRVVRDSVAHADQPLPIVPVYAVMYDSPMRDCYEAVKKYLTEHPEFTALIAKSDELAIATLAACRDIGRPVPESVSVVNMGNWHTMEFTLPPMTCVDFNFTGQFEAAGLIHSLALTGSATDPQTVAVESFLVERGTVGPVSSLGHSKLP